MSWFNSNSNDSSENNSMSLEDRISVLEKNVKGILMVLRIHKTRDVYPHSASQEDDYDFYRGNRIDCIIEENRNKRNKIDEKINNLNSEIFAIHDYLKVKYERNGDPPFKLKKYEWWKKEKIFQDKPKRGDYSNEIKYTPPIDGVYWIGGAMKRFKDGVEIPND